MAVSPEYRAWILELLGRVGHATGRSMFGGFGLYLDGVFFALVVDDTLYFKVDDSTRPDFEAARMGPFRPYGDERAMGYYEVPPDVLEDPEQLRSWAGRAVEVARRAARSRKR
jgi:DNA transformation protein and related proteins